MSASDMDRNVAATAIYRLGMCYRKLGSEADAFSTFAALAKLYPEQRELISKSLILNMKPAPWADGEVMRLSQKRIGVGTGFGLLGTYSVESGEESGKPVWYLRYFIGSAQSPIYYSVTKADAATMLPIDSRFRRNETWLESRFTANNIEVVNLKDNSQPARQIKSTGPVYDAWQLIAIMRRLPLQPGFEAVVPVFEMSSGSFANVRLQVTARETITVPAGTYDCYKVVMVSDDGLPNEQTFWITADDHAYVARAHIDRINEFELSSVETVGKNQPANFELPGAGISLSTPSQWYLWSSGSQSLTMGLSAHSAGMIDTRNVINIGAPDLASEISIMASEIRPDRPASTKTLDRKREIVFDGKEIQFQYHVRPDTRESVTVAGFMGERFIADTADVESAEDLVQYTYRFSSATKMYTFIFQTGKDNFDKMRSTFESIISSVRVQ
jgi:hypothetical protein